ncbi:hypothetical protein GOBAR_AA16186 [Gossypium barbadense]|uniref:Uncharacterized protein n=1 Tax=Gossypium barbadense TaxID=3634 RepID=A0A2P5XMA2_GOSBA|nr:hypothetical protein GOBAR_AA16186 [Gossypium barbadense]
MRYLLSQYSKRSTASIWKALRRFFNSKVVLRGGYLVLGRTQQELGFLRDLNVPRHEIAHFSSTSPSGCEIPFFTSGLFSVLYSGDYEKGFDSYARHVHGPPFEFSSDIDEQTVQSSLFSCSLAFLVNMGGRIITIIGIRVPVSLSSYC